MTVSQWAEKNRVVIRGPKQGPWSNEFALYAVKAMDLFNEPHIQKIVLKWAPQTIKTSTAINMLWKEVIEKTEENKILKARCDLALQTVPAEVIALSCGIDVQKYGFWFVVRAWARDFTSWLINYGQLAKSTDVGNLLFESAYPVVDSESRMCIWRCAMDTGGGGKFEDTQI